jgi:DNA-binding transcriptional MerR regulator
MNKKDVKDDTILSIGELAKASGVRQSTLKYYTEIGILSFTQDGERLIRKYKKDEALNQLEEIRKLKEKRLTIKEIIDHFTKYKNGE